MKYYWEQQREELKVLVEKEIIKEDPILSLKQRVVLVLRFGLLDGVCYSLAEVGKIFKLTRERIRQIEAKALTTLMIQEDKNSRDK